MFDRDSVLLDADLVFHADVAGVFATDFALGFTANPQPKTYSTINTGVIFARHARKPEAIRHGRKLVEVAHRLRFEKDPRFPKVSCAGVWGLDELLVNHYLPHFLPDDRSLKDTVSDIDFGEVRPIRNLLALVGPKYNADPRNLSRDDWGQAAILHFNGSQKDALMDYCRALLAAPPFSEAG